MKIDLQVYVDEIIIGDAADKYGLNRYKERNYMCQLEVGHLQGRR